MVFEESRFLTLHSEVSFSTDKEATWFGTHDIYFLVSVITDKN